MTALSRTATTAAATAAAAVLLAVAGALGAAPASAVRPVAPVLGPEVPVVYGPVVPDKDKTTSDVGTLGRKVK